MAAAYIRRVSIWTAGARQELSSGSAEFIATPDFHAHPGDLGKGDAGPAAVTAFLPSALEILPRRTTAFAHAGGGGEKIFAEV
jgi:hypothetical protein